MRKKFLLCGLMAIAAINFISCDDEDENNDSKVENKTNNNSNGSTTSKLSGKFVSASDCLGSPVAEETRAAVDENNHKLPELVYKYDKSKQEIEINIENATLTCGSLPKMEMTFKGDTIIVNVFDSSDRSSWQKCQCTYNVKSIVNGAESKVYYVRPEVATNEEDVKILELSQKEEGRFAFSSPYVFNSYK